MADVGGRPHDAIALELLEHGWRRHLTAGGLAGTLEVEAEVLHTVARALGDQSRGRPPREVARQWPACVVVALAQIAGTAYRDGRFWPGWHRASRLRASRRSADDWGQAFLEALTVLGITSPEDRAETAVLVHAAVPDSCLRGFLLLLADRGPQVDAADLDLLDADPAVAVLLGSGVPAAASFVDQCHGVLRRLMDGDSSPAGQFGPVALPRRVMDAASVVTAERTDNPALAAGLRLDPFGQGVLVVSGTKSGQPALPDDVVDEADPLLTFDEGGERVGPELPAEPVWVVHPAELNLRSDVPPRVMATSRLPLTWHGWRLAQLDLCGVSWLELDTPDESPPRRHGVRGRLKPGLAAGRPVPGVTTANGSPVFARLPTVLLPGTGRWRVEIRRSGGGPVLAAINASAGDWQPNMLWRQAPRPVLGELTLTVTPVDRSAPNWPGPPAAALNWPGPPAAALNWPGPPAAALNWPGPPAAALNWPGPPAAALAGLRRTLTVVEGLETTYSPAARLTADRGLEPAEALLAAPPGITVSPQAAPIPADSVTIGVVSVAGPIVVPLRVTPPHIRMRVEPEPGSGCGPTAWHYAGPLALDGHDLRRGGALRVDLAGTAQNPRLDVVVRTQVVQVLEPTRQGCYPLRRMLDTVSAHGGASLRIAVGSRVATIAHISIPYEGADPWLPAGTTRSVP
jgi:hypothetical protein